MLELQGLKKKNRRKVYKTTVLVIIVVLGIVLVKPTFNIWQKNKSAKNDLKEAENRLSNLEEKEKFLSAELKRLESQIGQEEEIVRKFDVVKEGEQLAVILNSETEDAPEEAKKSLFSEILSKYFSWILN